MKFVIDMEGDHCWLAAASRTRLCLYTKRCIRTERECAGDLNNRPEFCPLAKIIVVPTKIDNSPFEVERWGYEKEPTEEE